MLIIISHTNKWFCFFSGSHQISLIRYIPSLVFHVPAPRVVDLSLHLKVTLEAT